MNKRKQGKVNRARGKAFELKVRKDLEEKGWIVFRNSNDVKFPKRIEGKYTSEEICNGIDYPEGTIRDKYGTPQPQFKQTTGHWNPFTKSINMTQSGFPDFVCISEIHGDGNHRLAIFVECKGGDKAHNKLDAIERNKADWIINNLKIPVIIATKGDKRGEIVYKGWK